jgi:hypothetical protein
MLKLKVIRFNSKGVDRVGFIDTEIDSVDLIFMDDVLSEEAIKVINRDLLLASNNKSKKRV